MLSQAPLSVFMRSTVLYCLKPGRASVAIFNRHRKVECNIPIYFLWFIEEQNIYLDFPNKFYPAIIGADPLALDDGVTVWVE